MNDPFFFGYGSLVNRATHGFTTAYPGSLRGWRRVWRQTRLRDVAMLTVEPAEGVRIDGLIAAVPGADWMALDEREWAYDRLGATHLTDHTGPESAEVHLYSIPDLHRDDDAQHPIRLSYLDVVIQGYLREFGKAGAERFFETTVGWEAPVMNDRTAPIYARHQPLTPAERDFVDANLRNLSAEM